MHSCWSGVGKPVTSGPQEVSLGLPWQDDCKKKSAIIHELGHALGFWHEQTRPDRDQYVKVHWDRIIPGKEFNFMKLSYEDINSLDVSYDYNSIMHYPERVS